MEGKQLMERGIATAASNAEAHTTNWLQLAYDHLIAYTEVHRGYFLGEDARAFAEKNGLPVPPSRRAWGAIMVKAKKEGLVKSVGFSKVKNPLAHHATATLWITK